MASKVHILCIVNFRLFDSILMDSSLDSSNNNKDMTIELLKWQNQQRKIQ